MTKTLSLLAMLTTSIASQARAVEYLPGSSGDDTIVYGELAYRYTFGQCYLILDAGPGICVFARTGTSPYRGTLRSVAYWSDPDSYPFGVDGDPSGSVYGADRIYPADHYAEPYIYCGYYGGIYWYVTIDHRFWGVYDPCDDYYFDVTFPADATMEIWGDGGTISGGTADWLYGWDNADYIRGGGGGDLIHGAAGNDSMNGDYGGDTIYGDTCSSGTEYFQGGGDAGSDKLYGATGGCDAHMYGGDGGDELHGTDQGDVLDGEAGWKDHVLGYGGNDELWGGSGGDDICDGGNDTDTCHACCEPPLYNCEP